MAASQELTTDSTTKRIPLPEIARMFFLLGILGFGGPAAHIALMENELVTRREWLSREYFLDLLAAINLVPGPTSTEMALQIGYVTAGFWGMMLAGAGFIVPAVVLSLGLAMLYTATGTAPAIQGVLLGVRPVVLVLILSAAYRLGIKAIDNRPMRVLLALALIAVALGSSWLTGLFGLPAITVPELALLLATGIGYVLWKYRPAQAIRVVVPIFGLSALAQNIPTLPDIFWRFFVIGGTLFGSGYVLAAYMQRTFVDGLHWLTPQQLLNTLAIGQATPGPLLSTSAAAGYLITVQPGDVWSGVPGGIVAAGGVFLPAFIVVLILWRVVPLLRRYPIALDFLKGVNAGVIALLIGTFASLAYSTVTQSGGDWLTLVLTVVSFVLLERYHLSPITLIAVGAVIGIVC